MTIAKLLELHPWPAEWAQDKRIERLWVHDVPGTPEALWPLLSDTSRMNRALGLAEMQFEERDGKRWGTAKPGGIRHDWVEMPWNWVANQWLSSLRVYERGFFRAVWSVQLLEPIATGTRVYLYFGTIARNALAGAAIRIGFRSIERAYQRVLPALAAQLDRLRPEVLLLPAPPLPALAEHRLRTQRAALVEHGLAPACVDAVIDWIRTGDDQDLHRIQIRERARVWNLPETELLKVALYATRAGLLMMSWDTVCPHCRGVRDENASLSQLAAHSHCGPCDVTFATDTQESVEVTFRVHRAIRDVPEQLYCSAEPAKRSHVRVQWTLPPGGAALVNPRLERGRYTVRRAKERGWYLDVDDTGDPDVRWATHPAGEIVKATPGAGIELQNEDSQAAMFTIEQATWSDHALRAGQLLGLQEFRDLFSDQYIGADVRLGVGEQTLLFTDVVGSTAFYAERGDPDAFIEIKRHFDEVFAIVAEHRGAVVKTIGDAVMATFIHPVDALRASHQIHQAFHPTRADTPIRLRISLNTGPCIAVRLNSNADFFGGTVNVAAKLQSLAEGYQIAMSDATYGAPGVAEFLAQHQAVLEPLSYRSKALPAPVGVQRWTVFREPSGSTTTPT
ncbi:MAG: Adenylate cyclase [Deltaproteobacteria bacterium]|nr:Adenylate cyclase [Deltaproteobacteria bacterium]